MLIVKIMITVIIVMKLVIMKIIVLMIIVIVIVIVIIVIIIIIMMMMIIIIIIGFTSPEGKESLLWSVAGLAVGPNGTIYLWARTAPSTGGSVWSISRQNLTCAPDFNFNCNTTACLCKEGKYATQGPANATFCERCSPRHYCICIYIYRERERERYIAGHHCYYCYW